MRSMFVLVLIAACSHSDAPPPKTAADPPPAVAPAPAAGDRPATVTDDMVASADRVFEVLTKTVDDVAAAGKDCKAIAAALRKHLEPMKAIAPEANKLEDIKDEAARKWFENKYGPKLAENNDKMKAVMACKDDADVQAAMGEMKTAASTR
jgi:hypothetical protein